MIKYQYAKDESDKLIDINSLDEINRGKAHFFCVGCGNELIPRLGNVNIHHFAHKKVVTCSGETYLHQLGKKLFYDNYVECLKNQTPFFIETYQKKTCNHYEKELGIRCKLGKQLTKFDLTQHFDKISIEAREGSFIADIMLTSKSSKDNLFIEIAVTHLSTEAKLNSKYRIIEIEIDSEEDFEPIKRKFLSINHSKIKFRNFKINEITKSICGGNCTKEFNLFTIDHEGRPLLKQNNLKFIRNFIDFSKEKIVKHFILKDRGYYPEVFKGLIANCASNNLNVRNCFICRYHAENNSFYESTKMVPIFCKLVKVKCNSNQAVECDYFRQEPKYIQNILSELNGLLKTHEISQTDSQSEDEDELDYDNMKIT